MDEVLVETAQCDWESIAVKGFGGEGQNAQMQDCYVLYHENGTTFAINHLWTGDDGNSLVEVFCSIPFCTPLFETSKHYFKFHLCQVFMSKNKILIHLTLNQPKKISKIPNYTSVNQ